MRNVNRVIIAGNLTRDPEFRQLPSSTPVANLGLAANRRYRDKDGNNQEETTFVECEAFGRLAEVLHQYARKGRPLFIEGRLRLDQWQDKEGHNRSRLKIVVENFQFTDVPAGEREGGTGEHRPEAGEPAAQASQRPARQDVDEVLPF